MVLGTASGKQIEGADLAWVGCWGCGVERSGRSAGARFASSCDTHLFPDDS